MTRPNILLITTDQHRWDWLGCHGTPGVHTPHLDALAARGTRITNHVTNAAVCVPARIGLATGVTPLRLGALGNQDILDPAITTYYQALRDAGYRVGCVGKLDLDKTDSYNGRHGDRPKAFGWGFTHPVEVEGKMHAGGRQNGTPLGPYGYWLEEQGLWQSFHDDYMARLVDIWSRWGKGEEDLGRAGDGFYRDSVLPAEAFADAYIGRRSCEWIEDVPTDFPWHLYVSFVGPHDPYDPPTKYADQFRNVDLGDPASNDGEKRSSHLRKKRTHMDADQIVACRRQYTAALAAIDDQVGEIIATLERTGQLDNTIVMFSADHGEMLGDHGLFQKDFAYEASMRVPMIAAGPGIDVAVSDAPTELVDVSATVLDYAETEISGIDGRSMRPIFDSASARIREATTCSQYHYRAIRTAEWKYIENVPADDPNELYDLVNDPTETHNLIDEDPSTAAELRGQMSSLIGADFMPA